MTRAARLLPAVAFLLLFGLPLLLGVRFVRTLSAQVPSVEHTSFNTTSGGEESTLVLTETAPGRHTLVFDIHFRGRFNFIELEITSFQKTLPLKYAAISMRGLDCRLLLAPNSKWQDNEPLIFKLDTTSKRCLRRPRMSADLVIETGTSDPVALKLRSVGHDHIRRFPPWVLLRPSMRAIPGDENHIWMPEGRVVWETGLPPRTRAGLLSSQWQNAVGEGSLQSFLFSLATIALIALGILLWGRWVLVGTSVLVASLLGLWCVANPPLQAPDELDHFLSSRRLALGTFAEDEYPQHQRWAMDVHFDRLKQGAGETFNGAHVQHPFARYWGKHVSAFQVAERSTLETWLFQTSEAVSRAFGKAHILSAEKLFTIRAVNAFGVWLLLFGTGALFYSSTRAATRFHSDINSRTAQATLVASAWSASLIALFLVPAMPLFLMHVSNYGLLAASFVAATTLIVWRSSESAKRESQVENLTSGALVGSCIGLLVLAGRAGLVGFGLLPMGCILVFISRLGTHRSFDEDPFHRMLKMELSYWTSVAASLFIVASLATPEQSDSNSKMLFLLGVPGAENLPLYLALGALTCGAIETALLLADAYSGAMRRAFEGVPRIFWRVAITAFGLGIVALFAWPRIMDITPLANNEIPSPLRGLTYVKEVVPRFVFGLGFAKPEFLLTESFWSGFGWLEIRLDGKLIRVLKSTPIVPLILAFALLSRKNWTLREPFRQVVLLVGSVAVVAALSYASTFDLRNIHGRYLIPAYALVMCGSWMSFFLVSRAPVRLWMLRLGASLVLSLQFHSLTIVLERYFA